MLSHNWHTEINHVESRPLWKVGVLNEINSDKHKKRIKSVSLCSIAIRASHGEKERRQEGDSIYVLRSKQIAWGIQG